jgi:16S rRNA (cytidine1402-2'-O)-methyltransferase
MTGRIVLAATPIGNSADASPRLRELLETADVIAAEDTRRLRDLASRLGLTITAPVVAVHDHNERDKAGVLVGYAAEGKTVALVSDAGMPAVSDPGFRVVEAAAAAGVDVTVVPGPSAVLTALALSGLATDRFTFEGFLPRKPGERASALSALSGEARTMVFFEAPHRLVAALEAMGEALGADRRAAVSRELTKTYEETKRGTVAELVGWARAEEPRGEMVLTVSGRPAEQPSIDDLVQEALRRVESGERAKDAVADLAEVAGLSRRDLYAAVLAARKER